ncbi:MAG: class I SAM-dependent methyltransferase [bacterium]|nr:class I SAM-dependent methyltransferase [bacterium]
MTFSKTSQPSQSAPFACPVCEAQASFTSIQEYMTGKALFSLYECSACKVQFWMPFRNPGADWYEQRGDNTIQEAVAPKVRRGYHKQILSLSDTDLQGKKVLDVGCGTGEFLAALQARGCKVWGVDFDHIAIGVAKNQFRLECVFALTLGDFFKNVSLPQFDIITCFEVIEHVDNPLRLLAYIRKTLQPHGRVFLSTPSRVRIAARSNVWDYPPNHLTRWSEEAFSNVAQKAGFQVHNVNYVDQFRILLESMQGSFQTGLVKKVAMSSGSSRSRAIKTGLIRFLGVLKAYALFALPAFALWLYGKAAGKKNGSIFAELRLKG